MTVALIEHSANGLFLYRDQAETEAFAADWDRLAALEPVHTPTFTDVQALLANRAVDFRLVGQRNPEGVTALGLFVLVANKRDYWLGEKRFFRLPLRSASLFGGNLLGAPNVATTAAMIDLALGDASVDLLALDDLPIASGLYALAISGRAGPARLSYHNSDRQLIALPATMAGYWSGFRSKTRVTALGDLRAFERLKPTYEIFTGRDAIEDFLPRAAALSAQTYQIHIGQGLIDSPDMRRHFARLAEESRLICYLASVAGEAAAFVWGEVAHGIFYYRMTGYATRYAKASAGKGILFHVVRDLIEARRCHSFDFGIRDMEYKHRFANRTVPCAHVLIARPSRPRALVAIGLDRSLDFVKTRLPKLIGTERLRRIRRMLRR